MPQCLRLNLQVIFRKVALDEAILEKTDANRSSPKVLDFKLGGRIAERALYGLVAAGQAIKPILSNASSLPNLQEQIELDDLRDEVLI